MVFSCLVLALISFQGTRTEAWPSGSRKAEYETVLDEDGAEVRQGFFRSYYERGEVLESEGAFEAGKESGAWSFFHPDGALAETGRFADGLKSGAWRSLYPDGKQRSKGSWVRGVRSSRWSFWREDGSKDLAASGLYELFIYRSKEDSRHYRGYVVDNLRQGRWSSYWPDGTPQFEGHFEAGQREGTWVFTHPDGVQSALLLTGEYHEGKWAGALQLPAPPVDVSRFPPLRPLAPGWPADRQELAVALRAALLEAQLEEGLRLRLAGTGVRSVPVVLEVMAEQDPESERGRTALGFLEQRVLRELCSGHTLSPLGASGPPDAEAAREVLRAWLSLWALTCGDTDFWHTTVPGPSRGVGLRDVLQDPPLLDLDPRLAPAGEEATEESPPHASGEARDEFLSRFGRQKRSFLRKAPSGTKEGVARGLRWLAAHQTDEGYWDNDGFSTSCGKIGRLTCQGPGAGAHDVGATGLALLAFLGDGHTPAQGKHAETVTRGLEWLVKAQSKDGMLGLRLSHNFIYNHAIATAALCEGVGMGAVWLRAPAERALEFLMRGRDPAAGWRYDVPSTEGSDTSVTGWAVNALVAAHKAGLPTDPDAFDGALTWMDHVTDGDSGRAGYANKYELSARTPENEHFPREKGEALTAVALWVRLQVGQDPTQEDILAKHAALIATCPPIVDPEGNDTYFWYYATYALQRMGAPFWKPWEKALKKSALGTQEKRNDATGSWDPAGPWGHEMGRVCTTALMVLTLECYYRGPGLLLDGR